MRVMRTAIDRCRADLALAWLALRAWGPRQIRVAVFAALGMALIVGLATVLIPNPVFVREIAPVAWNYPVWLMTSALTGMLVASYVRPVVPRVARAAVPVARAAAEAPDASVRTPDRTPRVRGDAGRGAKIGGFAGVLAWFAVGCPVCNKIALLALGYTGALTWFAPFQPVLAVAALALSAYALVQRLRGQASCPVPVARAEAVS